MSRAAVPQHGGGMGPASLAEGAEHMGEHLHQHHSGPGEVEPAEVLGQDHREQLGEGAVVDEGRVGIGGLELPEHVVA